MGRLYPRFSLSYAREGKNTGIFITHNLKPRGIANVIFDSRLNFSIDMLEWWDVSTVESQRATHKAMEKWAIANISELNRLLNEEFEKVYGDSYLGFLTKEEFLERETLLEKQRTSTQRLSWKEFDRLTDLSNKLYPGAGSPEKI